MPPTSGRLTAAYTVVREMADADYVLDAARVGRLDVPTPLLLGERSAPFLQELTKLLASVLPGARIAVMKAKAMPR